MTLAQLEKRVDDLENKMEQLQARLSPPPESAPSTEDDELIPGVEYPVVLNKPPTKVIRRRGIIRHYRPAPLDLGLSDAELKSLIGEEDYE